MTIKINGKAVGHIISNRTLTTSEIMWSLGYDITDEQDCKAGYERGIEGFCLDDDGKYYFDPETDVRMED